MSAPAETLPHGTAQSVLGISDEPASTPTVKVTQLSRKYGSERTDTKNTNGSIVYAVNHTFMYTLSFKGQRALASGLAVQAPGSTVATLANFATTDRTFDPAVGSMILENIEDSLENFNRAANTSFDVVHLPHCT